MVQTHGLEYVHSRMLAVLVIVVFLNRSTEYSLVCLGKESSLSQQEVSESVFSRSLSHGWRHC